MPRAAQAASNIDFYASPCIFNDTTSSLSPINYDIGGGTIYNYATEVVPNYPDGANDYLNGAGSFRVLVKCSIEFTNPIMQSIYFVVQLNIKTRSFLPL